MTDLFQRALYKTIKDRGWSIKTAAARCGIPYPSMQYYLNGRGLPSLLVVRKLCDGLQVPPQTFVFPEWVNDPEGGDLDIYERDF